MTDLYIAAASFGMIILMIFAPLGWVGREDDKFEEEDLRRLREERRTDHD